MPSATPAKVAERMQVVLYAAEVEPVTKAGVISRIEGRAVPYGVYTNRGIFMESVAPGCFDKSIAEAAGELPLLLFHGLAEGLDGKWPVGLSVRGAWDSKPDGLYGAWSLDESQEAQRAGQLARDGMLKWFSVGHSPIRSEWEFVDVERWNPDLGPDYMDKLTRIESRMLEVSLLTDPAFPQAQVISVMSAGREAEARHRHPTLRPSLRAWQAWRDTLAD